MHLHSFEFHRIRRSVRGGRQCQHYYPIAGHAVQLSNRAVQMSTNRKQPLSEYHSWDDISVVGKKMEAS